MRWNPDQYLKFSDLRLRPALDLIARIPLAEAQRITDLGCGTGIGIEQLAHLYPNAEMTGVDSSVDMLDAAQKKLKPKAAWVLGDIKTWQPPIRQDLLFSNAALHWVDHHETLFPKLMQHVSPGGVLAVQMPNQYDAPSHVLMREVARNGPWADGLKPVLRPRPVADGKNYFNWLKPYAKAIDIWETQYMQALTGDDPVFDWISSTALRPLWEVLEAKHKAEFTHTLSKALRKAYPVGLEGITIFSFKRLFIVAQKAL